MSFTYGGDPQNSSLDALRLSLGDTDGDHALFQDEEITWFLDQATNNVLTAAALAAGVQAKKYARQANKTVGPLKIDYGERAERWSKMAAEFTARAEAQVMAMPYMAGEIEKDIDDADESIRNPAFRVGMHDSSHYDSLKGRPL